MEESNLHRQPLYRMADVGQRESAEVAWATLAVAESSSREIEARRERLDAGQRGLRSLLAADVIVDAADSFARHLHPQ